MAVLSRETIYKEITKNAGNSISSVLVGMYGVGKSNFVFQMIDRGNTSHGKTEHLRFIRIDSNLLVKLELSQLCESVVSGVIKEFSGTPVGKFIQEEIRNPNYSVSSEPKRGSLERLVNCLTVLFDQSKFRVVVVIDSFDSIYAAFSKRDLLHLRALRDLFKRRLCFLLIMTKPFNEIRIDGNVDQFTELFTPHTFWLPPCSSGEIKTIMEKVSEGFERISSDELEEIIEFSGGHPALAIAIYHSYLTGIDHRLTKIAEQYEVKKTCKNIYENLSVNEIDTINYLATEKAVQSSTASFEHLLDMGLIKIRRKKPKVFSSVFEKYVGKQLEKNILTPILDVGGNLLLKGVKIALTPLEFAFLEILLSDNHKIVTKNAAIDYVYGAKDIGNKLVADGRLEAMIKRLRKKLYMYTKRKDLITNVRGFGYRFDI